MRHGKRARETRHTFLLTASGTLKDRHVHLGAAMLAGVALTTSGRASSINRKERYLLI